MLQTNEPALEKKHTIMKVFIFFPKATPANSADSVQISKAADLYFHQK